MSFDWKKTLATVAPTIATALGGPLAGMAVGVATRALGIEVDPSDPASAESALASAVASGNPEILLKLKQADNNFIIEMEKLGIKREQLANEDRHSARQLFSVDKRPQIVLSTLFILGYFALIGAITGVMLGYFDTEATTAKDHPLFEVFVLLVGLLTREVPTIMQFWFGTSSGSKDKTGAMGAIRQQLARPS